MPILERQGARIAYEISGDGPPLLLGHSLLCDARMWELIAPELEKKFRVVNINARGHGGSTAPAPFSLDDLADDWLAIIEKERLTSPILCGLSMGGMTAMRVALSAPGSARAMILMDSSADRELPQKRAEYLAMATLVRRFGHLDPIYQIVKKIMFGATTLEHTPAIADRAVRRFHELDLHQTYHAIRAITDRPSIYSRLSALSVPTLVLVGNEDRATPPFRSERITKAIPGAMLRYIPYAGHLSALENPSAILLEIDTFLSGLA